MTKKTKREEAIESLGWQGIPTTKANVEAYLREGRNGDRRHKRWQKIAEAKSRK